MPTLADFIQSERGQYVGNDNNLFAFSLGQASRYYEFVTIIFNRHKDVSQKFTLITKKFMEETTSGVVFTPEEQARLFEEVTQLTTEVHLEIESFYLFAKTLLDKLALSLQDYFGPARGISLISHDKLTKSHENYRAAKGLEFPDGFAESLLFLKAHVCDYRDKQISHLHNPRTTKGTIFGSSGETRIMAVQLLPKPNEIGTQVESSELPLLFGGINTHIGFVIAIIEQNRAKTRFRLKEQSVHE